MELMARVKRIQIIMCHDTGFDSGGFKGGPSWFWLLVGRSRVTGKYTYLPGRVGFGGSGISMLRSIQVRMGIQRFKAHDMRPGKFFQDVFPRR